MLNFRIIPCLLLSDEGLVKTVKFSQPKYVGDPINAIKIFNEKQVDELIVLDISASKQKRSPNFILLEQLASECFMPLCYGGGIRSLDDAKALFDLGIEKISLQSVLATSPELITNIAKLFGEQAVVVSIDVKKNWIGKNKPFSHLGANYGYTNWQKMLTALVDLGAGEVLLNAVDRDGTRFGMDLELISEASALVDVPITAIGGAGDLNDFKLAFEAGASAGAAGAFFVFQGPHNAVLISYPRYSEIRNLWSQNDREL